MVGDNVHTNRESVQKERIVKINRDIHRNALDPVVVESPLEIRLSKEVGTKNEGTPLTITMRTPGDDLNLATGFLFAEGIIQSIDDIVSIKHCGSPETGRTTSNTLKVELKKHLVIDLKPIQRKFSSTSRNFFFVLDQFFFEQFFENFWSEKILSAKSKNFKMSKFQNVEISKF